MKAPDLDPATLRWVAKELERDARRFAEWSLDVPGGGPFRMVDDRLRQEVKRLRSCATRIERKRRKP